MGLEVSAVEKNCNGYIPYILSDSNVVAVSTIRDKVSELWSFAEYYTISDSCDSFLLQKGYEDKKARKEIGNEFKSYMLQARNFYQYASNSDYRSSALLYFYAFENLTKAKLVTSNLGFEGKKMVHGIKRYKQNSSLKKLSCRVDPSNKPNVVSIFDELYKLRFGINLPVSQPLNIVDLLGYASDVAHEYNLVFSKTDKCSRARYLICIDNERKKCWVKLAISNPYKILSRKNLMKNFYSEFQEISIGPLTRELAFNINSASAAQYRFFESKIEYDYLGESSIDTFSCDAQLRRVLGVFLQNEIYDRDSSFQLVAPLGQSTKVRFDEMTAIYAIMFHLSEIVRYEPYIIQKLLTTDTKEGWILKNFIESAPRTFLMRMISWITSNHYLIDNH